MAVTGVGDGTAGREVEILAAFDVVHPAAGGVVNDDVLHVPDDGGHVTLRCFKGRAHGNLHGSNGRLQCRELVWG